MRWFGLQTSSYRAYTISTGSDGADHWHILQLAAWAFRGCVGSCVNFPPKFHCDQGGAQKRRFGPQTSPYRAYTPPRALMTLIIGAPCSLQPRPSDHMWIHMSNSYQNPGVAGGVPENGELTIKRHRIEHILPPRAPMALIIGVPCSSQSELFGYTRVIRLVPTKNSVWSEECAKTQIWTHYVMESGIYFPPELRWPWINAASCSSQPGLSGHTCVHMANSHQKLGVARGVVQTQRFEPQTWINQQFTHSTSSIGPD